MTESIESLKAEIEALRIERDALKRELGRATKAEHLKAMEMLTRYQELLSEFESGIENLKDVMILSNDSQI